MNESLEAVAKTEQTYDRKVKVKYCHHNTIETRAVGLGAR